jgi:hypothetical protein
MTKKNNDDEINQREKRKKTTHNQTPKMARVEKKDRHRGDRMQVNTRGGRVGVLTASNRLVFRERRVQELKSSGTTLLVREDGRMRHKKMGRAVSASGKQSEKEPGAI